MSEVSGWAPTPAHLRAVVAAVVLGLIAVVGRRIDLAVLGAPFLAAATIGTMRRPRRVPQVQLAADAATLTEGQATTVRLTVSDGPATGGVVAGALRAGHWSELDPAAVARLPAGGGAPTELTMNLRSVRWGRHRVEAPRVTWTSDVGAHRVVLRPTPLTLTTLPLGETFAAPDALPRPAGLVGLHRSRRHGEGSELAEVRPFRAGDRLRRINWPVSSRMGTLHVTAAWTDRDTEVVLLLDTEYDLGVSGGIDAAASSLDIAVRASAAIAEHYILAGDRVSLTDIGQRIRNLPAGSGRGHLRRLLDVLVVAEPGVVRYADTRRSRRVRSGSLVIALSPLLGAAGLAQIAHLVQQGHALVVIDTLPAGARTGTGAGPWRALAWRVRLLERSVEIDRLNDLGVPVVPWRGRSTLDEILRDVSRLAEAPRIR